MMKFDDSILGVWFVSLPDGDFLGCVNREPAGASMTYRFRYYHDERAFDSNDDKSWYRWTSENTRLAIESMSVISHKLSVVSHGQRWELIRGDKTFQDFMTEFTALPWVHTQKEGDTP